AGCDGAGSRLALRRSYRPLVRVRGKKANAFRRGARLSQKWMQRLDGGDGLQVSVVAGMVVRPGHGVGFPIVRALSTRIGFAAFWIVKKVRRADALNASKP